MQTLSNRRLLPVPLRFNAKHAEPAVLVMEGDALDHAGDLLGRGLALWDSGMHTWEFILPRWDGAWVIQRGGDLGRVLISRYESNARN